MSGAFYNEFDPAAAAWLRELIRRGLIADGEVDERSILDVTADDLRGFTQCHFFAGIGGWSLALRLAGWPDERPVWTGSPPCQPFSPAGKQKGQNDDRHLAPYFVSLVAAGRPDRIFGEQVSSAAVFGASAKRAGSAVAGKPEWAWLDDLSERLEAARYAVGASDIPAAGVGAPHIRQRTFFGAVRLADSNDAGLEGWLEPGRKCATERAAGSSGLAGGLDRSASARYLGPLGRPERDPQDETQLRMSGEGRRKDGMADTSSSGRESRPRDARLRAANSGTGSAAKQRGSLLATDERLTSTAHGGWDDADWLLCRDGKWRPVESSLQRMADGLPGGVVRSGTVVPACYPLAQKQERRVMRLRGYGNAIVPQVAAAFIIAFEQALTDL